MITVGLIVLIVLALVVKDLIVYYIKKHKKENTSISFKESLDLTEMPVVTFIHNDHKLNFLLDTGSNHNLLDESVADLLDIQSGEMIMHTSINAGGKEKAAPRPKVDITVGYKGNNFTDSFYLLDMSEAFNTIKAESGVTIHGIIGNAFMSKYKYVLDFDEMIAYYKK